MRVYKNLNGLKQVLRWNWEGSKGIFSHNQDCVTVITGAEGIGKSTLLLHLYEYWNTEFLKRSVGAEDVKNIGDNRKTFIEALYGSEPYAMICHDEAGKDLYSRDAMGGFNKDINKAYIVIRGLNLHTVLCIPNILDLETYFRNHRVKQMIHVTDFGKFAYFDKKAIMSLIPKIQRARKHYENPDVMKLRVKPVLFDSCGLYENEALLKAYNKRKAENMLKVKEELYNKYVSEVDSPTKMGKQTKNLLKMKAKLAEFMTTQEMKDEFQVTERTIQMWKKVKI